MLSVAARLYDRVMRGVEEAGLATWRTELFAGLAGDVLEIGAGTGRNLDHYPTTLRRLVLTEPDRHMRAQLDRRFVTSGRVAQVVDAPAESLPFPDATFDAVVSTLVLCSVADQRASLAEIRRVLRPGGKLVFIEHVAAQGRPRRLRWQHRLEPVWRRVAGNCHLTRQTEQELLAAGFRLESCERASMRKAPPVVRPVIRGIARLAAS